MPGNGESSDLDQVCIPGIATNAEVVVTRFLLRRLAEDVAWERVRKAVAKQSRGERQGWCLKDDKTYDTWRLSRSGRPWLLSDSRI